MKEAGLPVRTGLDEDIFSCGSEHSCRGRLRGDGEGALTEPGELEAMTGLTHVTFRIANQLNIYNTYTSTVSGLREAADTSNYAEKRKKAIVLLNLEAYYC